MAADTVPASESHPVSVLVPGHDTGWPIFLIPALITHLKNDQKIFVGVINPIDPRIESAEEVRDRVLQAAEYIPVEQLGTTDDCGFSPFSDDTSTSRDTAFAKIRARVLGTALASKMIAGR